MKTLSNKYRLHNQLNTHPHQWSANILHVLGMKMPKCTLDCFTVQAFWFFGQPQPKECGLENSLHVLCDR